MSFKDKARAAHKWLKEFFHSAVSYRFIEPAYKKRMELEHLFMLVTIGDMSGLPILPPYYSLKILPYMIPNISAWKRRMHQEKDVTDLMVASH